ncbi:hypothetical protein [Lysinibacillus fusiformis]|uniref:Uncharacterized protein n=1 Tax=Lysinibacillus fusiformis TaxID=28031 RepID=A0A1E4QYH6_9BACI|nr:hypothetical protein [Lysinibacillus fusiformis]ODV53238.1 hypothetical protein BG258_23330 [Lysinibacillus fusiformis]
MKAEQAFELALRNFPKWMDIRKRKRKSTGALYLRSFTDESLDVEVAIEELRKSFFAYNYIGIEASILDYLRYVNIGKVDVETLSITEPNLKLTTDYAEFIDNSSNYAFFEDGKIFISYDLDVGKIKYVLKDMKYESPLHVYEVWNTIDEFALFSGIERFKGERNADLLRRVFAVYKNIPNSTRQGIKNAIVNDISNLAEITPFDIDISILNNKNIHKASGTGGSVSDEIIAVDKDVYRAKVWDQSLWDHSFKELIYGDNKWDESILIKQNGTGQKADLATTLLSELQNAEATDVEIDVYKKSSVKVQSYIKDNRTSVDIPLNLTKYKDELSPISVEYKVIAEDAKELTQNVYIESYSKQTGEFNLKLDDVVIDRYDKKYTVVEGGVLTDGNEYKITLYPKNAYSRMGIEFINYKDKNESFNYAVEKDGFTKNGSYIESDRSAFYGDLSNHFYESKNMKNVLGGITLADAAIPGELSIDVSEIENKYVKYEVSCELTDITTDLEYVTASGFKEVNNAWEGTENDGTFVIEGIFSELTYLIEEGNMTIEKIIDGKKTVSISNGTKQESYRFDRPTEVKITFKKIHNSGRATIKAIKYSRYDIEVGLSSGSLIVTSQGIAIPRSNGSSRYLTIKPKTYTGFSPIIKYVYIGSTLAQVKYETSVFTAGQNASVKIKSNCIAEITNLTTGEVIYDYNTDTIYSNETSEEVYMEIDSSTIEAIEDSRPTVVTMTFKNTEGKYIRLAPGESITGLWIKGNMLKLNERKSVSSILAKNQESIYLSKFFKKFIVKSADKEQSVRILRSSLDSRSNLIMVKNLPNDLSCVFVTDETNNKEIIGTSCESFESIYFMPKNINEYVMYEMERMVSKEIRNISLINNFYPQLDNNRMVILRLDKGIENEGIDIMFEGTDNVYSVGFKKVKIIADKKILASQFSTSELSISRNFVLTNYMELPPIIKIEDKECEIAEFIVKPDKDYEVVHEKKMSGLESYYVKNDGFNKLYYSNIASIVSIKDINGKTISKDFYDILHDEGIIYWKDLSLSGMVFSVQYEYNDPKFIKVINTDVLYKIVGYTVDTLALEGTITYQGIYENTSLSKEEKLIISEANYLSISSSNPKINASLDKGVIILTQKIIDDDVLVKPGYFYSGNKEWYYFVSSVKKEVGGMANIDFHEVEKINGDLILSQASVNHVTSSNMLSKDLRKVFKYRIQDKEAGESTLNAITACDSYNIWRLFNSDIYFTESGFNGKGLYIKGYTDESYATMEITQALFSSAMISLYADDKLECFIAKQNGRTFNKNIYCDEIIEMSKEDDFRVYRFKEVNPNDRYFLIVKGEGIIDDIMIGNVSNDLKKIHKKTLNKIFFDIPEEIEEKYKQRLLFDKNYNTFNRTEIDEEGYIITSTDLEWGLTKLGEINEGWDKGFHSNVTVVKDSYIKTTNKTGLYYTKVFEIDKLSNLGNLYVKINEMCLDVMKDFSITVLTSSNEKEGFSTVGIARKDNVIKIDGPKIKRFVKVVVEIPPHKVIENISLFGEYKEGLSNIRVRTYPYGDMITKIYDVGFSNNFQFKRVLVEDMTEGVSVYVRGIKQNNIESVTTDWKRLQLDSEGNVMNYLVFDDYELFQFKINLEKESAAIKINGYELEVIR